MTRYALDSRINDILRERDLRGAVVKQEVPYVPSLPPRPGQVGTPATVEETMDDGELGLLLGAILPELDRLIGNAIRDVRSDGKLTWVEAMALAPEIRNIVSRVVAEALPQIKGTSARELVIVILTALIRQYVSPRLPAVVRPWMTAQLMSSLIRGLEWAYQTWVKKRPLTR